MTSIARWLSQGGSALTLQALLLGGCQTVENPDEVELRVFLVWYDDEGTKRELAGVELCQTDTSNCDETDPSGQAAIFLPRGEHISYSLTKEGFAAELYANVTDADFESVNSHRMFTNEEIASLGEPIGKTWPVPGTGLITLGAYAQFGALAGVTVELVGESNRPYYLDEDGVASYELTATTGGSLAGGAAGFPEILPGEYEVEFGGSARNCQPERAWSGSEPNRVRVPVKAEHISFANVRCEPRE
jgi:hypothetical protein